MQSIGWLALACLTAACGGSGSSSPSPSSPTAPSATTGVVSGRVVGTLSSQPIAGATVRIGSTSVMTDADGTFRLETTETGARPASISGNGIVARSTSVSVANRNLTLDVIETPPFDLGFFRKFARDGFENPGVLSAIRRLTAPPRLYIRTIDEAGQSVDAVTLDTAERAFLDVASTWSGGAFGLAGIERGTETRDGMAGWLTVKWPNPPIASCGHSPVGAANGEAIQLNYLVRNCGCGSSRIAPSTVRHELGHVFGFWHTGSVDLDVMSGNRTTRACDIQPSEREVLHARYLYARPAGNTDPDNDPAGTILRHPLEARSFRDDSVE